MNLDPWHKICGWQGKFDMIFATVLQPFSLYPVHHKPGIMVDHNCSAYRGFLHHLAHGLP